MNKNKSKSKKTEAQQGSKETLEDAGQEIQGSAGGAEAAMKSPTSTSPNKPVTTAWFINEIQHMMHGFGDCKKPLQESAALVEEMVHQEMITLIYKSADVAALRGARFVGMEDLLFLMRKDKAKLKRLIQYMTVKDMKASLYKSGEDEEAAEEGKPAPRKKRKLCYDFLSTIDQTGELLALFDDDGIDEIKQERMLRAELQTRDMNTQQYLDYHEARQASFAPRYKCQKFKDWLMHGVTTELKPNAHAVELLAYLAYETVAQIVDMALLVRRDGQARVDEPMAQMMPPVCISRDFTSMATSLSPNSSASSSASATTGASQPPASPTSTNGSNNPSIAALSTPNSIKAKAKKKKKPGYPGWKDFTSSHAIQPSEIHEAIRRFSQPTGPFADFSKRPLLDCKPSLYC